MADFLQPVSRAWRLFGIVGSALSAIILLSLSLAVCADMVRQRSLYYEGRPLWLGVAFIGLFGMAAAFISWRLARRHVAHNGVTLIPTWLIQVFGIILVPGMFIAFHYTGFIFFLTSGAVICLAMIFVRRNIAKAQNNRPLARASVDGECSPAEL
ncbi:MAG TPA: hypothetical protein VGG64_03630 [Pirellulales bacterium]